MATIIYPFADTYLDGSSADSNYGGSNTIEVGVFRTGYARGLMAFDLSSLGISNFERIESVVLYLYNNYLYLGQTIYIYRLTRSNWTEYGATWNKYDGTNYWTTSGGDYTTTNWASVYVGGAGWYSCDITALAQDSFYTFNKQVHILLWGDNGPSAYPRIFYSKENSANKPYLSITLKPPVVKTTSLATTLEKNITVGVSLLADLYRIGQPLIISPFNNSKAQTSPMTFMWYIPEDVNQKNIHCEIQVARDENFTDIEKDLQTWKDDGFEFYNGSAWVPYPKDGVPPAYYGKQARITIPLTEGKKWWRVRGGVSVE